MNTRLFDDSDVDSMPAQRPRMPWLQALREADARRPALPGEHVVVLGVGLLMLAAAARSRSFVPRLATAAIGGALVGRAASGTGGVTKLVGQAAQLASRYLPR